MDSTPSGNFIEALFTLKNGFVPIFLIILSAFFGGLFAGLFNYYFESKGRLREKRRDKYFENRNTIVQIEHELIPVRVNMSRNLNSIKIALDGTSDTQTRIVLRFYKLLFSTGLSLKLLNLNFINLYSELFSALESINSDMEYISGMTIKIRDDLENKRTVNESLIESYKLFLAQLKNSCESADAKSLQLLLMCQIALRGKDERLLKDYIKNGKEISYNLREKEIAEQKIKITNQENRKGTKKDKRPQFVAPYIDIRKEVVSL
jgi:hypothetical protein